MPACQPTRSFLDTSGPPSTLLLETLWRAGTLGAVLLVGEGLALVLALAPDAGGDRWVYFGLASLTIQWITLLTLAALYLSRRWLRHLHVHQLSWLALMLLMVSTWVIGTAAWMVLQQTWPMAHDGWVSFLFRLSAITLIVGLLGLVTFQNHWRSRQLLLRNKQAELEVLHARIRPHFVFNTLNTGIALVRARPAEAERLLLDLADLFRAALSGPHEVKLSDEIALTRRYLDIEELRFGNRLRVEWSIPKTLPDIMVPALSIQPLAENAIRHGVEPSPEGGIVNINVVCTATHVQIVIANDLCTNPAQVVPGFSVGLNSAKERIRAANGGLIETAVSDTRHTATVSLPLVQATIS